MLVVPLFPTALLDAKVQLAGAAARLDSATSGRAPLGGIAIGISGGHHAEANGTPPWLRGVHDGVFDEGTRQCVKTLC
mgnify:CR=1 FL=1